MPSATAGTQQTRRTIAFGLRWDSDVPLHQFEALEGDDVAADVSVGRSHGPLKSRDAVITIDNATLCTDGVRYRAGKEAIFDVFGATCVEWMSDEDWTGEIPAVFFSTLTALLLAWRGQIPLHGTAVEIGGKAVLICGQSGAGKSTLAAGLIALGAKLISDDLSVLHAGGRDKAPLLYPGRPALRLFPAIADFLEDAGVACEIRPVAGEKCIVRPPRAALLTPVPLDAMIVLGHEGTPISASNRAALLQAQLFRPRWMRAMPGSEERLAAMQTAAEHLRMFAMEPRDVRNADAFSGGAERALDALRGGLPG